MGYKVAKLNCKLVSFIICFAMISSIVLPVKAWDIDEDINVIQLKPNCYQTMEKDAYILDGYNEEIFCDNYYKMSIPYDAIVTVQLKGKTKDNSVDFYGENDLNYLGFVSSDNKKYIKKILVMEKGTYYLVNEEEDKPVALKYTIKKYKNKKNFHPKKAIRLKKNKNVIACQTFNHNYDRWYKIKLKKEQKIQVIGMHSCAKSECGYGRLKLRIGEDNGHTLMDIYFDSGSIFIYNKKGEVIDCKLTNKGIVTQKKMPKGTYYLKVNRCKIKKGVGEYVSFKWK